MKPETPLEKLVLGLILLAAVVVAGFLVVGPAFVLTLGWIGRRRRARDR